MADSDGGAFRHQHEGCRLADNLRMADHHHFQPLHLQSCLTDQLDGSRRRAWRQRQVVIDDVADGGRVHALDILERMNGRLQRAHIDVGRHRALQDDAEDRRIVIHGGDPRLALLLAQIPRPELVLEGDAGFFRDAFLVADINGNGIDIADGDGDKPPDPAGCPKLLKFVAHCCNDALLHCAAIEVAGVDPAGFGPLGLRMIHRE